jgi:hypothetical protein
MEIEKKECQVLKITDVKNLDLVTVIIEDIKDGQGNITILCYGKAWTAYWGAMGYDRSISKFFCDAGNDYLASNLFGSMKHTKKDYNYLCRIIDAVKEALREGK